MEKLIIIFNLEGLSADQVDERIEQIANMLFSNYAIEANGTKYRFVDLEFYYSSPKHRDFITHPREGKRLHWYINDFGGIDINFDSNCKKVDVKDGVLSWKYQWDNDASFGGVLIRQLMRLSKKGDDVLLNGPLKVSELFREFDAIGGNTLVPQIVRYDTGVKLQGRGKRINLVRKDGYGEKLHAIKSWYRDAPIEMDENEFRGQVDKKYRFWVLPAKPME